MAKKQKSRAKNAETSKNESAQSEAENTPAVDEVPAWSPKTRLVLSIVAVVHLFAVFSAPWSLPQPSSQLSRAVDSVTSNWTHMLYMRHGYRFFAPDPGPSHLILFEVTQENGETVRGRFPDRNIHQPRLLYHRFFMISEHFWALGISQSLSNQQQTDELIRAQEHLRESGFVEQADWILQNLPQDESEPPSDEEIERLVEELKSQGKHHAAATARRNLVDQQTGMKLAKRHRDVWLNGIATYLKRKHSGTSVRIWIQEHMIPDYDHMLDGGKLNDPVNFGPQILVYSEDEEIQ